MGNDISNGPEQPADDVHEMHKHPDLATREAHLAELIQTLRQTGPLHRRSATSYHAGYTSYREGSKFSDKGEFSWS